jgi:hypothetical protein
MQRTDPLGSSKTGDSKDLEQSDMISVLGRLFGAIVSGLLTRSQQSTADLDSRVQALERDLYLMRKEYDDRVFTLVNALSQHEGRISGLETELRSGLANLKASIEPDLRVIHNCPQPLGIIEYLTRQHGGNLHDLGFVTVSASHPDESTTLFPARNILDIKTDTSFWSSDEVNQWCQIDFRAIRIKPTHYSLQSPAGRVWPVQWVIEGSANGRSDSWVILDSQNSSDALKHPIMKVFPISQPIWCRFIRFRQTDRNGAGHGIVSLRAFELYGEVETPAPKVT